MTTEQAPRVEIEELPGGEANWGTELDARYGDGDGGLGVVAELRYAGTDYWRQMDYELGPLYAPAVHFCAGEMEFEVDLADLEDLVQQFRQKAGPRVIQ